MTPTELHRAKIRRRNRMREVRGFLVEIAFLAAVAALMGLAIL